MEWERAVDQALAETGEPVELRAAALKVAFDKLETEQDQLDGIRRLLDLAEDESVAVVYPILFDRTCSTGILDVVFADVLNRPEEIKQPVIGRIADDPEHPLCAAAAHILSETREETE